ncbi:MAG: SDR family oxidoreductase [Woeseiaceae bacterium]|nr:SDR family oxidoreductase [Woeseiaceae bacterium]
MTQSLNGKIAIVTGGSRNIGRETALRLAASGADVIISYRQNQAAADSAVAEMRELGVRAAAIQADFTGTSGLAAFVDGVTATLGDWGRDSFDMLINNAGALRRGLFEAVSEDDLDFIYETNYKSVFFLTQKLGPLFADNGRIVNLGSGTARIAFGPLVAYGPLKAALTSLTLYLASYFGGRGITVNTISPGGLDDDFNADLFEEMPQARDYIRGNTALGRIGLPGDVAGAIEFLCRPEAGFISGATINVDGGYHL